ncbi:MAG TPA: hypothetical protein VKZ68_08395, partial [Ohtaekwangia sp.]|nr:hypothetical protein [Ohtaekwangia sp.]
MKIKPKPNSKALLFVMKVTLLNVLITSLTIVFAYSLDSNGQEVLDKKVSLRFENADVKQVLAEIEERMDVNFTYRPRVLRSIRNVSLEVEATPLRQVLDRIFIPNVR